MTGIHTWNAEDSTRIVVALDDTIKFDSVRIASPDRIYFDLYKAKLGRKLPTKQVDVQSGLLKSIRVAQNKPTVSAWFLTWMAQRIIRRICCRIPIAL